MAMFGLRINPKAAGATAAVIAGSFIVCATSLAAQKVESELKLAQRCLPGSARPTADELQAMLAENSLTDANTRHKLIEVMQKPDSPCRKTLETWLGDLKGKPVDARSNTGRMAAVTLGVLLDLPAAKTFVGSEAESGGGLEWLATLQQWDEKAFAELLQKWVIRSGDDIRKQRGLAIFTRETYGKQLIADATGSASLQAVPPPVVFDQYLKLLAKRPPGAEELNALNAIYVNLNSGARGLYSKEYVSILRKNSVAWVNAFRVESAWVQFQLLELMGRTGGAEVVRELMWLSQNHQDPRIKSRASQALDEAVK
jgi:hypothetical protein